MSAAAAHSTPALHSVSARSVVAGIGPFDDALDQSVARDHAAIAAGIGRPECQQRQRDVARATPLQQAPQRVRADQRIVGIENRHLAVAEMWCRRPARRARCRAAPAAPRRHAARLPVRTASMSGPITTTMRSNTCSQLASRWRSIERPASLCSVLGSADFMRVPRPAARMTAVRVIAVPCFSGVLVAGQATPCQSLPLSYWFNSRVGVQHRERRTLLLDLDGTLVHSVPDLAAALNRLMVSRGLPAFSEPEVALMVGDGVARLVERAFGARGAVPDSQAIPDYSADYAAHAAVATRPYPGVGETLHALAAEGWAAGGLHQQAGGGGARSAGCARTGGHVRRHRRRRQFSGAQA